jgi:hypothetical protein
VRRMLRSRGSLNTSRIMRRSLERLSVLLGSCWVINSWWGELFCEKREVMGMRVV